MSDSTLPLSTSKATAQQRPRPHLWSQPVVTSKLALSLAYGLILLGFTQAIQWL